jgi:hypothetical protein
MTMRLLAVIIVVPTVALFAAQTASTKPTLVEFRHVGDDGLSERLADQIERAFRLSADFTLSSGRKPGTLIVTIPTNVDWKQVGGRTQVLYTVEFTSSDDHNLGSSKGSCWEGALVICAEQIVNQARTAVRKMH